MGNAFVHVELNTPDLGKAKQFYKKVFKWKLADMPMGDGMKYTMVDVGKGVGGGMQVKPMPEAPTSWLPYVEVDDVKKTLAKAKSAGAQIALEFTEIGEMGAIGVFIDPTGAGLGVWQQVKPARKPKKKAKSKRESPRVGGRR